MEIHGSTSEALNKGAKDSWSQPSWCIDFKMALSLRKALAHLAGTNQLLHFSIETYFVLTPPPHCCLASSDSLATLLHLNQSTQLTLIDTPA